MLRACCKITISAVKTFLVEHEQKEREKKEQKRLKDLKHLEEIELKEFIRLKNSKILNRGCLVNEEG